METTLYADVLFFVNFSMDFLSIWASSRLCSLDRRAGRMASGAAVGALYGVVAVVTGLSGIFAYISAAAVSVLMAMISFGLPSGIAELLRRSAVIWGSGALLGGLMTAFLSLFGKAETEGGASGIAPGGAVAAVCAAALYVTVRIITRTKAASSAKVSVTLGEKSVEFTALCDSGNLLRDPISGDAVMPVSRAKVTELIGRAPCEALCRCRPEELAGTGLRVRLIPHRNSTEAGLCAAFLPDSVTLTAPGEKKEKRVRCLIAPMDCPKNHFGGYAASLPAELL